MTIFIERIAAIASDYDVIVFDQWGVLHNGTTPYPDAIEAVEALTGTKAVLSNSGKRSEPNAARIAQMGFATDVFDGVMTSGEALWRDIHDGKIEGGTFLAIERQPGDATDWTNGLDIEITSDPNTADAVLLMGLPDGATLGDWTEQVGIWIDKGLPLYCSNPDRQSPRAGGLVTSPGALAFDFQAAGGDVTFYGKPHRPVFEALETEFGPGRYLMVGDSMEHDIAGAHAAGWDSLLVQGGLYADRFRDADGETVIAAIAAEKSCDPPTYRIEGLR